MEDDSQRRLASDLLGTVVRPPSIRVTGSFKSTLSGRLTPRSSPSFRKSQSVRTPLRESRTAPPPAPWYAKFPSRRLLPWLIVIGLWSYICFLVQSRWAHSEGNGGVTWFGSTVEVDHDLRSHIITQQKVVEGVSEHKQRESLAVISDKSSGTHFGTSVSKDARSGKVPIPPFILKKWAKTWLWQGEEKAFGRRKDEQGIANGRVTQHTEEEKLALKGQNISKSVDGKSSSWIFPSVGVVMHDSVGNLVGPFEEVEKKVLGSKARKTSVSCEVGLFARFVRGKTFMLVLHELSMTGAPLAMMELGSQVLSCGGKVSAIVLSRKGGLFQELSERGIKVLKDKGVASFRAAARVDLVVVGSAVCATWIEQYVLFSKKGSKHLAWWIMENRREYFDRSKHVLSKVRVLIFLSELQLQQWQTWTQMEGIVLPRLVEIVHLSVNEELSMKAGLQDPDGTALYAQTRLRDQVRQELGLNPRDMLLITLSSINPGKGQLLLLQAAALVMEGIYNRSSEYPLFGEKLNKETSGKVNGGKEDELQRLKLLIGSVGSKSNKAVYIKRMLEFVAEHPSLAKILLWTPATVHVSALYSAADAYVMNSQGIGETFGRVTIEAMAFSLPILGTYAGGTMEIVIDNVTGLLHPVGSEGIPVLAEHIIYLLRHPNLRDEMGYKGREKVKKLYLKEMMYEKLANIFLLSLEESL